MDPRLSIILPYHNSEATLERTLMSLANQTAPALELLLVNDGSTDRSHDIAAAFIRSHSSSRLRIVDISYEYQRGASEAFNLGMKHATASYVCKCDSDDTLPPDYYDVMLQTADADDADIVASPIRLICGQCIKTLAPRNFGDLNRMAVNTPNFSLCNKIIRRSLLADNNIEAYPHINCWEDLGVIARLMALRPKTCVINSVSYNYYLTPGRTSLSRSDCSTLLRDHMLTAMLLEIWFSGHSLDKAFAEFLHYLKFLSKVKMLRCKPRNIDRWKRTFPEANQGIMHLHNVALPVRLGFVAIAKLPTGICQWVADKF